ncbi:hypothetical protein J2Z60_001813 [Lactobacillus colini]|uniref:Uncharacterized protein n=1 Tax=Lactobacillus colini TaxID=1819254 RepID=A0ABS4MG20_9LACO|nr:hypothetical protein [Lactobacillus colini]MBP2058625.1 hypothetical protein [Lactobacillus colini]
MSQDTQDNLIKASNALDVGVMVLEGFEEIKKSLSTGIAKTQSKN